MPRKKAGKVNAEVKKGLAQRSRSGLLNDERSLSASAGPLKLAADIALPVMFAGLALLLLVGPFYRGLFFTQELLVAQALIFFLLIIWGYFRLRQQGEGLLKSPLDFCLLILLLAYAASFFVAANKREALEELLKIGSYIVVYLVSIDLCRSRIFPGRQKLDGGQTKPENQLPPGFRLILHLAMIAAVVLTVASLGAAAGHWQFIGAYQDAGQRIASPMGYANTAAAYFMAAYLLVIALAPLAKRWWGRVLYLAPAALILLTTILTFSRGAWLLLAPLFILLVLVAAPGQRLRSFLYLTATVVPAIPAAFIADPLFRSANPPEAWLPIVAAVVAALVLGALAEFYLAQKKNIKLYSAAAGAVVTAAAVVLFLIIPLLGPIVLELPDGDQQQTESVKEVFDNIRAGEPYLLELEVDSGREEVAEQKWGIRVIGSAVGGKSTELLNYIGAVTDGWEKLSLSFEPDEATSRLEIYLYNTAPGTAVAFRSVTLSGAGDQKNIYFTLSRILPDRYFDRIFSRGRIINMEVRFEMFRDAAKIIRDYPLLGTGGGGWNALYQRYQERSYFSTEVHNHFLQVWVEAGILGFLAFLGLWVSMALAFIRNCLIARAPAVIWQHWTAAFLPVAALGAHSVIDWNFSLAAVGIYLFVLLGAGRSMDNLNWFGEKTRNFGAAKPKVLTGAVALISGLALFVASLVLIGAFNSTYLSQKYIEQRTIKLAIPELRRAISLDPLRAENYHNLGVLLDEQSRAVQGTIDVDTSLSLARRAHELEPYNPTYIYRYGELLLGYVDVRSGLEMIDRLLVVRPLSDSSYIQVTLARLRLSEFYIEVGRPDQAEILLAEIFGLEEKMKSDLGYSEPLYFIIGRTHQLRGDHQQAKYFLLKVREGDPFFELARQQLDIYRGEGGSLE